MTALTQHFKDNLAFETPVLTGLNSNFHKLHL